jgi:hypothetical protein
MNDTTADSDNVKLGLKEASGWFAANTSFKKALTLLSDGAFKLFAYICLESDRRTGRLLATHRELATALRKSKRIIGVYVSELETSGVCLVKPGKNQFARTIIEITDSYWPYERVGNDSQSPEQKAYVDSVRECFLALGCSSGKFGVAEAAAAGNLQRRGIPWAMLEEAMLLGACRKYTCWIEGQVLEPIWNLAYFEPIIAEIKEKPLPPGYSDYLRKKIRRLAADWNESRKSRDEKQKGGYPDIPS